MFESLAVLCLLVLTVENHVKYFKREIANTEIQFGGDSTETKIGVTDLKQLLQNL